MCHPKHLFLLLTIILFSCSASKELSRVDQRNLNEQIRQSSASFKGLALKELGADELLYDHNATELFTPASNVKLLTLFTTKEILGDSLALFDYYRDKNTIHIRGNGNPVLLHPDFEYMNKNWIGDLLQPGVDSIVIHHRETANKRFGSGWAWDDYPYYFQTEIHGLPLFGNSIWTQWEPSDQKLYIYPDHVAEYADVKFDSGINNIQIEREEFANSFIIRMGSNQKSKTRNSSPFLMDGYTATEILRDTLPLPIQYNYESANHDWQAFFPIPLDSVYHKMMLESDNFTAEQLLLAASSKYGDTLDTRKVIDLMQKDHFPESLAKINWVDGSGLSRYNLLTPAFTISVLEKVLHQTNRNDWRKLLSKLGQEGTVKEGFELLSSLEFYGKSGSLKHHYALSGYFYTKKGEVMLFSIMFDNSLASKSQIKREISLILRKVYNSLAKK